MDGENGSPRWMTGESTDFIEPFITVGEGIHYSLEVNRRLVPQGAFLIGRPIMEWDE